MKRSSRPGQPDRVDAAQPARSVPSPHSTAGVDSAASALGTAAPLARSIDLHIDELVLHGFSPTVRQLIADAVARELTSLLESGGLTLDQSVDLEFLSGAFRATNTGRPESTGAGIARAIYGGLRR